MMDGIESLGEVTDKKISIRISGISFSDLSKDPSFIGVTLPLTLSSSSGDILKGYLYHLPDDIL